MLRVDGEFSRGSNKQRPGVLTLFSSFFFLSHIPEHTKQNKPCSRGGSVVVAPESCYAIIH